MAVGNCGVRAGCYGRCSGSASLACHWKGETVVRGVVHCMQRKEGQEPVVRVKAQPKEWNAAV